MTSDKLIEAVARAIFAHDNGREAVDMSEVELCGALGLAPVATLAVLKAIEEQGDPIDQIQFMRAITKELSEPDYTQEDRIDINRDQEN